MKLHDELKWLYQLRRFGMKPGLERIREIAHKLDNPQQKYKVIHITGTNGKGSTAAMIAHTLKLAGHKVGMFTSPHLVQFNERFCINNTPITDEELSQLIRVIREKNVPLTFFEFSTAIAFQHFADAHVDYAVIEVGMGGTYDSTNIADGDIAVITSIGVDHKQYLGDTIRAITKEKCGIIKPKSIVITHADNNGLDLIRAKSTHNKLIIAEKYKEEVGLAGDFQKINAGIAKEVCTVLGVQEDIIAEGIRTVKWPGRLEYLKKNLLLDCAHNPAAIQALTPFIKKQQYEKLIIIFGVLKTKDSRSMIKALPKPDFLILTRPNVNDALDPIELAHEGNCAVIADPAEALRYAKRIASENDLILITGSCYLAGNIKALFEN